MDKKIFIKLGTVYILVFLIALYRDIQGGVIEEGNIIFRDESGGSTKDVDLLLDVENVLEDYEINLEIEPRRVTQAEAEAYFADVMAVIDKDILSLKDKVPMKKEYKNGLVSAEWSFLPSNIIGTDGEILKSNVPEDGVVIKATVVLQCDNYEYIYRFPIQIEKPQISLEEQIENELSEWVKMQVLQEGQEKFQLPNQLVGKTAKWKERKEYLSYKIVFLEIVSVVLLFFVRKKELENMKERCRQQREKQYPEIVNQLLILMEAGMTTRQAWYKIAYQYAERKRRKLADESEVYEAIVQMNRRLTEGENERVAYENFGNQMEVMCYRRLMRILLHNLEKGSRDLCQQLNLEAKQANEQRILFAKKIGEEASTKMLIPMMLMMVLVMVIVMAPAVMGFAV